MAKATREAGTEVWAICLMPYHVHTVMVPAAGDGLRASPGEAHRRHTRHVSFREGWRGHLWQARFHSIPMDEANLLAALSYVELNPVKGNLCPQPQGRHRSGTRIHLASWDDVLVRVGPMPERIADRAGI